MNQLVIIMHVDVSLPCCNKKHSLKYCCKITLLP